MPANTPNLSLPYPTSGETVDVPRDIKALADAVDPLGTVPVGAMAMWLGPVAPALWLLMLGQTVPASTYPGLAVILGQAGGLVTIPDMTDRFPVGASGPNPVGGVGGSASVTLSTAQMPSHGHGVTDPGHAHLPAPEGGYFATYLSGSGIVYQNGGGEARPGVSTTGVSATGLSVNAAGGGAAHENRPPFRAVNFIIRAL